MSVTTGILGVPWGSSAADTAAALGMRPLSTEDSAARFALDQIVERLSTANAFCPSVLGMDRVTPDDVIELYFDTDALVAAQVHFRYPFRTIGLRSDTLSDSAMTLIARAEFHGLLAEFTARYGAPAFVSLESARIAALNVVAAALFVAADGGTVQLFMGHESASLGGEIRWLAPARTEGGF